MKTVLDNGKPYSFDDLLSDFTMRMVALSDMAEFVARHEHARCDVKAMAMAISNLRDDWEETEAALIEERAREHPEDYADADVPHAGQAGAR